MIITKNPIPRKGTVDIQLRETTQVEISSKPEIKAGAIQEDHINKLALPLHFNMLAGEVEKNVCPRPERTFYRNRVLL